MQRIKRLKIKNIGLNIFMKTRLRLRNKFLKLIHIIFESRLGFKFIIPGFRDRRLKH
jgi:hypothetical protein